MAFSQYLFEVGKTSPIVKKCADPLQHLGIAYFLYCKIKQNGDFYFFTTCPQAEEYYCHEKLYVKDLYSRHPDNYQNGFFFFDFPRQDFEPYLTYLAENFSVSPLIGLCERGEKEVEFFGFWSRNDQSPPSEQIYLNHGPLLKSFAAHFKQVIDPLINKGRAPYLPMRDLVGPDLFDSRKESHTHIGDQSLQSYWMEMGYAREVQIAASLSKRERQCIQFLLHGKSTKETGTLLNLSSRTIEHYFENIKNKLNCQFKHEVFILAEKFSQMGLI